MVCRIGRCVLMALVTIADVASAQERYVYTRPVAIQTSARVKGVALPPEYPGTLKNVRVTGIVLVRFLVEPDGTVNADSIRVVDASHPEFADAVRIALRKRRYQSALQDGRPVRQWIQERFVIPPP